MERYRNLGGDLGVLYYEIGFDYIIVKFLGVNRIYIYSYCGRLGYNYVENMIKFVKSGSGLNVYINNYVKYLYDK